MHPVDVLVIGRSCLDFISVVERFPEENRKLPLLFRLKEGGGQGGTAACCISRLGGKAVYVGRLGDDEDGRFCLQRLKDFGVDTGHVEIVKGGRTPVAYIFVTRSTGARTIIYEVNELPRIEWSAQLEKLIAESRVLLLDPETTTLAKALVRFRGNGTQIVYDCERWREGLSDMMAAADYFIPSIDFLASKALDLEGHRLPEKLKALKKRIRGHLIVTNGEDGAYFFDGRHLCHVAAPSVQAVDTIGAGDNFHATFALAVARGMNLHQAVSVSVASASMSCRQYGGRNGIPTWEEASTVAENLTAETVA
jgi:sugar/nucleoside kinase (ribokinase family)